MDQQVDVTGTGFAPNRKISIAITANTSTHEEYGWPAGWLAHDVVQADADGNLSRTFTVPGTVTGSGEDCTEVECFVASFSSAQAGDATPVDYRADRSQDVLVPVTFAETDPDPDPDPEPEDPEFTVSPSTVRHGDVVTFTGEHLTPGETASVAVTTEPGGASDGTLDWGVRESFRNYIQGSIANGSIEVHEPASRNDDDTFRFADGTGTAGDGSAELQFSGAVYFSGHDHGDGPLLELTVNDPRIQVDGDSGVLIADVTSRSLDSGELVDYPDVEFAALDLSDAPLTISDGTVSATDVPATLTAGGVPAFADFYEAGAELDPVSFEASISESQQVEIGQETVGDDGRVELTWTVPADFQTGTATAVLTAGDVELAREFTVEAAGTGDDDGNDGGTENGTDGGAGDGTETGDDSGSDGTDSGDGTDGGTEVGADNGTEDGNLPNTGGSGSAALLVAGLLLALGGTAVAVMSRRRVTI